MLQNAADSDCCLHGDLRPCVHAAAILAVVTKLHAGSGAEVKEAGTAPLLRKLMMHGADPVVRGHAAAALSRLPGSN